MLRKVFRVLLVLAGLCAAAAALAALFFLSALRPVSKSPGEAATARIQVPAGRSVRSVAQELDELGIVKSGLAFYAAARLADLRIQAGTYTLSSDMPVRQVFDRLRTGRQDHLSVSIPEGLTSSKVAALLEENGVVGAQDFLDATRDKALLGEYGIPAGSFEGYIFPDTYFFNPGMSAEAVLRMMVDNFFDRIGRIEAAADMSPERLFHVVRLASIVEREYRVASEAPLIASVFSNRLERGIGLYSCATIEYIITELQGRPHPDVITNKDLRIDSPYNTYMWAGLPPGPISNPGLVALEAAAAPPDTPYFYFRVTDPASGTHHFSEDFDEHIDAGKIYTKKAAGS